MDDVTNGVDDWLVCVCVDSANPKVGLGCG